MGLLSGWAAAPFCALLSCEYGIYVIFSKHKNNVISSRYDIYVI